MTSIFITSFLEKDYATLYTKLELVLIMWAIVLVAIIMDLISGLRKASREGLLHTSYGFRRTVKKAVEYYGLMCFAFMFDILGSLVLPLPYFSMIASVFLVFIEAKSVFEKVHKNDRQKVTESVKDLISLLEHRDDLAEGILDILNRSIKKEEENNQNHDRQFENKNP